MNFQFGITSFIYLLLRLFIYCFAYEINKVINLSKSILSFTSLNNL